MPTVFNPRSPVRGATVLLCDVWLGHRISIHAPRVGSDSPNKHRHLPLGYFNPRSPCGERLCQILHHPAALHISIHAPRVGSDAWLFEDKANVDRFNPRSPCGERRRKNRSITSFQLFQSTLPVWGATIQNGGAAEDWGISIHAPRVGSDFAGSTATGDTNLFQSTLPVWGATTRTPLRE